MPEQQAGVAAVTAAYAAYLAAFQQDDAGLAVQPYFQLPCLCLAPQGDVLITSAEALGQLFSAMKSRLRALDYARSDTVDMSVKLLRDDLAAISLIAIRYDRAGAELERLGAFYTLRRTGERWRIVQLAMYDADKLLRLA